MALNRGWQEANDGSPNWTNPFKAKCDKCGTTVEIKGRFAGQDLGCKKCGGKLVRR